MQTITNSFPTPTAMFRVSMATFFHPLHPDISADHTMCRLNLKLNKGLSVKLAYHSNIIDSNIYIICDKHDIGIIEIPANMNQHGCLSRSNLNSRCSIALRYCGDIWRHGNISSNGYTYSYTFYKVIHQCDY